MRRMVMLGYRPGSVRLFAVTRSMDRSNEAMFMAMFVAIPAAGDPW